MLAKQLTFLLLFVFVIFYGNAQLSGSIESNTALYINDAKIKLASNEADNTFRNNTYLRLDYKYKQFTVGLQAESYSPKALLNYSPNYKNAGLGTFYANYKNDSIGLDVTVGHFYEQFGSGLVLRTWEDRQLGVANSIVGVKVKFNAYKPLNITALYGKQRNGLAFNFTDGIITGINAELDVSAILKATKWHYSIGGSLVNRNEKLTTTPQLSPNTQLTSLRASVQKGNFSVDAEYAFKTAEALVENGIIKPKYTFDGDVYLLNINYSKARLGINANFRRTENFATYSQQNLNGNAYNQGLLSYVPALTKQFDYSLTNIYVYMAQSRLVLNPITAKSGELGGQLDVFYKIKPKTFLGGKYGTQVTLNVAQWYGLAGKYDIATTKYQADFLKFGTKFYNELGLEIRKKWSNTYNNSLTILQQYYNATSIEESFGEVNATTLIFDNTIGLPKNKSLRIDVQHQWANALQGNWAAASVEFSASSKWAIFATDLYNYGNETDSKQLHFYVGGVTYKPGAFRVQLSYGRQRGGLQCIGGICRFVSENAGFSMGLNYSF